MRWKVATARTTKTNRAATAPRHGPEHYRRDLNNWPRSWMDLEEDLPPGEQLLVLFRPFLEYLAASDLSPKTIQKHVDNIWTLGGEYIRDLHTEPSMTNRPLDQVILSMIEYGGPLFEDRICRSVLRKTQPTPGLARGANTRVTSRRRTIVLSQPSQVSASIGAARQRLPSCRPIESGPTRRLLWKQASFRRVARDLALL
jgi:hypothetical protein